MSMTGSVVGCCVVVLLGLLAFCALVSWDCFIPALGACRAVLLDRKETFLVVGAGLTSSRGFCNVGIIITKLYKVQLREIKSTSTGETILHFRKHFGLNTNMYLIFTLVSSWV